MHIPVPDQAYDAVYCIESVCYAQPLEQFLREASRVLKPGGRLVFADGYRKRVRKTNKRSGYIGAFCTGMAWNISARPLT
jgi:ubiquinone/menaquinone biosynthesis C-methylase UbiE